jgi:RHS repeat-associated protein
MKWMIRKGAKYKLTTYERDSESTTDYAINRQYAINTGRFMQPDPVAGSVRIPQSLNRYSYAVNDPLGLMDKLGLSTSSSDPYAWMTDASWHGPGVYLDGTWMADGFESLAFSLLEMGAGVVYNGPSTVYHNGQWLIVGFDALGRQFYQPLQRPRPSLLELFWQIVDRLAIAIIDAITKQDRSLGDILRFKYIAWRTGLADHITGFEYNSKTHTFKLFPKKSLPDFLRNSKYFAGPGIAFEHFRDVGFPAIDFRSYTGQLGRYSLQIVYNPNRLLETPAYADFDRFNPYQDIPGFFGHIFGESLWHKLQKVGNIFK